MIYLFALVPFTAAIGYVLVKYHRHQLNIILIRRILWSVSAISFMLTVAELGGCVYCQNILSQFGESLLYSVYINAPTVIITIGMSVLMQFADFSSPAEKVISEK